MKNKAFCSLNWPILSICHSSHCMSNIISMFLTVQVILLWTNSRLYVQYHIWNESPVQVQCRILDAWGWCTGTTQRDGTGREEGGGFRMGNTCIPVYSYWYIAKLIQYYEQKNFFNCISNLIWYTFNILLWLFVFPYKFLDALKNV